MRESGRSPRRSRSLLVWDAEEAPHEGAWAATVLWRRYGDDAGRRIISMPRFVDDNADVFRARFLSWVHDLGHADLGGRSLADRLELRPGFSYWWVTSVAQRFNTSATSRIDDAIAALALEQIVERERIDEIVLVSADPLLADALREYARRTNIRFESSGERAPAVSLSRRVYRSLPAVLRQTVFLGWYLWRTMPRGRGRRKARPVFQGRLTFMATLVHLDRRAVTSGQFLSNYWTLIVDAARKAAIRTNWLHNFFAQSSIPRLENAQSCVERFTESAGGMQVHALFEDDFTLSVVRRGWKDMGRLRAASRDLMDLRRHFTPAGSQLDFWPLFEQEWVDSICGHAAVVNCVRLSLYERALQHIPRQERGVYIQENQPWEMLLVHAWKAAGHGELIGVAHTTVRYWDLRYFYDPRSYQRTGRNDLPMPDRVAVNGPVAKAMYLNAGYPPADIAEVEALRYVHLLNASARKPKDPGNRAPLEVLVCGDFLASTTQRILSWITAAAPSMPSDTRYVLKPHPAYPLDLSAYTGPPLEVTSVPIAEALATCDVAFTGNLSSTAADAYCAGVPVVQMLDGRGFNASPLRGLPGVAYVTSSDQLANALLHPLSQAITEPFFFLDAELPRWQKLLRFPAAGP